MKRKIVERTIKSTYMISALSEFDYMRQNWNEINNPVKCKREKKRLLYSEIEEEEGGYGMKYTLYSLFLFFSF